MEPVCIRNHPWQMGYTKMVYVQGKGATPPLVDREMYEKNRATESLPPLVDNWTTDKENSVHP